VVLCCCVVYTSNNSGCIVYYHISDYSFIVLFIPATVYCCSVIARSACVRVVCFKVFTQLRNSIKITVSERSGFRAH